jgi:hypothetical protein
MNMYMYLGSQAVGALNLADRIEDWDPEHQAKLREVGLRSSFELDDEDCLHCSLGRPLSHWRNGAAQWCR